MNGKRAEVEGWQIRQTGEFKNILYLSKIFNTISSEDEEEARAYLTNKYGKNYFLFFGSEVKSNKNNKFCRVDLYLKFDDVLDFQEKINLTKDTRDKLEELFDGRRN